MASTRSALREVAGNVDESMGVRPVELKPQLSPIAAAKDIGRTPLRKFGSLKVEQIVADPNQPRSEFGEQEIQQLASSIRNTGQLHPIRVRWDDDVEKWIIVTGERRYRAAIAAGLTEIDCYFHDEEVTESEILEQQLVENLMREDLKPLEEARGFAALMECNGWNGKQAAESLRVSPSKVSRALALLDLPGDVQTRIESGEIPRTSAYELSKLDNTAAQRELAQQAAAGDLTQRRAAKAVRQRKGGPTSKSRGIRLVFLAENGIKVTVTASRKGKYHEVEEALLEALDEVRGRIRNRIEMY
jgi:ParB family chromosome partitioning protein